MALKVEEKVIVAVLIYSVLVGVAFGTLVYFLLGMPSGVQL